MMLIKQKPRKLRRTQLKRRSRASYDLKRPFIDHLYELRKRLIYVVSSVFVFSIGAYFVQEHIVSWLLAPAHNQQFIYTSPGGGINFLFQVCTYAGILFSVPVIIYQLLKFLEPVVTEHIRSVIARYSVASIILALGGVVFGYYVGLPLALHFLGHQFTTPQIRSLFTIQEYMSFVTFYLIGSALIFQLPIIILFINHIKPVSTRQLFKMERYVILAAFVVAMIMAPTTNVMNQLVIAGPIICVYQVSVLLVWWQNRYLRLPKRAIQLLAKDAEVQAERNKRFDMAIPL